MDRLNVHEVKYLDQKSQRSQRKNLIDSYVPLEVQCFRNRLGQEIEFQADHIFQGDGPSIKERRQGLEEDSMFFGLLLEFSGLVEFIRVGRKWLHKIGAQ